MANKRIIILELDNTRVRALAFTQELDMEHAQELEVSPVFPQYGWMEYHADDIWNAAQRVLQRLVKVIGPEQCEGLVLLNNRGSVVPWDRNTSRPLNPVIAGGDRRGESICRNLKTNRREPMLHFRTGLFLDPGYSAPKMTWLLERQPEWLKKAKHHELALGSLDSWLLWCLTGGECFAAEIGHAAATMLFDLNTCRWEPQLLAAFGIPAAALPAIKPTNGPYGKIAASVLGFELPILAVTSPESAALYALRAKPGHWIRVHYGKRIVLHRLTGTQPESHAMLNTELGWQFSHHPDFFQSASLATGENTLQWLKDGMGLLAEYDQAEKMALSVKDDGGVCFVPALAGLGIPWNDPSARGTLLGLNYKSTPEHVVRAFFEGMAQQITDAVQSIQMHSDSQIKTICADGRLAKNGFLLQFQADLTELPVEHLQSPDLVLTGAALMGGIAAGYWDENHGDYFGRFQTRKFEPKISAEQRKHLRRRWQAAIERSLAWEQAGRL